MSRKGQTIMSAATSQDADIHLSSVARYSMVIAWSEEDHAYLVRFPAWEAAGRVPGPVGHGSTYNEAAADGTEALEILIETANDLGWPLPPAG